MMSQVGTVIEMVELNVRCVMLSARVYIVHMLWKCSTVIALVGRKRSNNC